MKLRLQYLILLLCFGYLTSCGQTNNGNNNFSDTKIEERIDSTKYAVIAFDTNYKWLFKNVKPTNLTLDEIRNIDIILNNCVANYNPSQQKHFDSTSKAHPDYNLKVYHFVIDLSRYNRQYIPVINEKGEKEVWVNCFCSSHNRDWRTQLISVRDGGNCYFNLKINLTHRTYYELMVNGEA
jgi:hypothetical protein